MRELIVFVHGMVNFSHNRTKKYIREKDAQERLIREQVGFRHNFLGAFDDSGNFAFLTEHEPVRLKSDVLAALNAEYKVKGAVVVERYRAQEAFGNLVKVCGQIYSDEFQPQDYVVWKDYQRWRLGMVLVEELYEKRINYVEELMNFQDGHVEILTSQDGFIGLLKFDPIKPRIPWGVPGKAVEDILPGLGAIWLTTGRSARTIRGILKKFQ